MIKEAWVSPETKVQQFMANEYVAACGKTPTGELIFKCDAAAGTLYYYPYGKPGSSQYIGDYHPCNKTHYVSPSQAEIYKGFVDYGGGWFGWPNGQEDSGEAVLVWRGESGRNGHATKSLSDEIINVVRS